jgi:hypothetical protein
MFLFADRQQSKKQFCNWKCDGRKTKLKKFIQLDPRILKHRQGCEIIYATKKKEANNG